MPLQFSQNFHKMMWGSQTDGSQEQQSPTDLCRSQNDTWQNDSQLSQSLLGAGTQNKIELFANRTMEPYNINTSTLNGTKQETVYTGATLSQMPLASSQNGSSLLSRLKPCSEEKANPVSAAGSKYTIPMWARGVRAGGTQGNMSNTQTHQFGQSNSNLQQSIQAKRMEAQQRDVKDYLMSLISSIDQLKKGFILGQGEAVDHTERFIMSTLAEKFSENHKVFKECLEDKFATFVDDVKKHVVSEYDEVIAKLKDRNELLEKFSLAEKGKSQQLQQAVSETMNLLGQVHNQVSCIFGMLETLRDDKLENDMNHNDLAVKTSAHQNALRVEMSKIRNEVDRLIEGQMVIREDMADINEKSLNSFQKVQNNLKNIMGNITCERRTNIQPHISSKRNFLVMDNEHKDPAEISTRLDPTFFNSSNERLRKQHSYKALNYSESKNFNKSYRLWDLAAGDKLSNKINVDQRDISLFRRPGSSVSFLPNIHTSTPKIVSVGRTNVSNRSTVTETRETDKVFQPNPKDDVASLHNNRPNKRADLKRQRNIPTKSAVTQNSKKVVSKCPPSLDQDRHSKNKDNLPYRLRSTAKSSQKHLLDDIKQAEIMPNEYIGNNKFLEESSSSESDNMFSD